MRLREFVPGDIDALAPMVADPEQMAFYPHPHASARAGMRREGATVAEGFPYVVYVT